ncbi:MAG: hypothetical protein LUC37_02920 [Prevotella sp.]|nr:hypothetical protein [Prevotella sp.]
MVNDLSRAEFLQTYKSVEDIVGHSVSTDNTYIRTRISGDNDNRKAVGGSIGDYHWTNDESLLTYQDKWCGTEDNLDELFKFEAWYDKHLKAYPSELNYFAYSLYKKQQNNAEYAFLKKCDEIWQTISHYYDWTPLKGVYFDPDTNKPPSYEDYDVMGQPLRCINGNIGDWWWYACNYLWANFPPLFWAYADMLNNLNIHYVPLFY